MNEEDVVLIKSQDLLERTGITYRQLDYWCRIGLIPVHGGPANPGSGRSRQFDESIVEKIKVVHRICNAFGENKSRSLTTEFLKKVLENYDKGYIDLGEDIYLGWR